MPEVWFSFAHPWWLLGLLTLIPLVWQEFIHRPAKQAALPFSRFGLLYMLSHEDFFKRHGLALLHMLTIFVAVLALAGPRQVKREKALEQEYTAGRGVDIIALLDISGSMNAVDAGDDPVTGDLAKIPNRLEAAKKALDTFIKNRPNDRIGLVTFAQHALTKCPRTLDHDMLRQILADVHVDEEASGTAIGLGLATALARLKDSTAPSRVIVLITDGRNNTGEIAPPDAAMLAAAYGVRVYAVGVGGAGFTYYPETFLGMTRWARVPVDVDMDTLQDIATQTGTGRAYRAQNANELQEVINKIDELEKTDFKQKAAFHYEYREFFPWLCLAVVLLLLAVLGLRFGLVHRLP